MSELSRKPATFRLDDPGVVVMDPDDVSRPSRGTIQITPEADPALLPVAIEAPILPMRRGFRWGTLFWAAVGGLVLLGAGLGVTQLIEDLFARSEGLGWLGLGCSPLPRRWRSSSSSRARRWDWRGLPTIEKLHARAAEVLLSDDRAASRGIVQDLVKLAHQNPQLARARATLQGHVGDIIDGADLIRLAERELMTPLDREARRLISSAAQRVSIVTAVSPRALIDVLFVFLASLA